MGIGQCIYMRFGQAELSLYDMLLKVKFIKGLFQLTTNNVIQTIVNVFCKDKEFMFFSNELNCHIRAPLWQIRCKVYELFRNARLYVYENAS